MIIRVIENRDPDGLFSLTTVNECRKNLKDLLDWWVMHIFAQTKAQDSWQKQFNQATFLHILYPSCHFYAQREEKGNAIRLKLIIKYEE